MKGLFRSAMAAMFVSVFVGCSALPQEEAELIPPIIVPKEVSYQTKPVARGDIENAIKVMGEVVPQEIEYMYVTEKNTRIKTINVALGKAVKKGDVLIELITDDLGEQIRLAEINLTTMQSDLETYKSTYAIEKSMNETRLATLEIDYDINQLKQQIEINELNFQNSVKSRESQITIEQIKINKQRTSLNKAQLKSTMDGTVVFIKKIEEGDNVIDYDKLIGIAQESNFQIEYEGTEAAKFPVGNIINVKYDGNVYEAMVTMTPDTVPEEDKELYEGKAFFTLVDPEVILKRGADVELVYIKEQSLNTLMIPRSLVLKSGEDKIVYVLENGIKTQKQVTTGVEAGIYVEILEGLNEGDQVIIN